MNPSSESRATNKKSPRKMSGNLASLAPEGWFSNRDDSSLWLRIYTSLFISHEDFMRAVSEFLPDLKEREYFLSHSNQINFAAGTLKDFKAPKFECVMFAIPSGKLRVNVDSKDKEIPDTNCVFIGTPLRVDGKPGSEANARDLLDTVASLICLHTGLNFMRHCIFEGEVKTKDGSITVPGGPFTLPQETEGPFLAQQNGKDISEISERISNLRPVKRNRIDLALQLFDIGMRSEHGFFEYWTALEVICRGHANKIKTRLKELYSLKSHQEVEDAVGFGVLSKWRHDYIHKGLRPPLTPDVERYLQLIFLDLLRQEIDLPLQGHVVSIQKAQGYDLSPLGLADNRTVEQRAADDEALRGADKSQ